VAQLEYRALTAKGGSGEHQRAAFTKRA